MSILIVAATKMEIQPFIDLYPDAQCLITGVGAAATVFQLMSRIENNKYDFILQAGLAGTFNNALNLGESVIVESDCFADLAVWENKKIISVNDLGLSNPDEDPFENGWLVNRNLSFYSTSNKKVKAITVNLLTDDLNYVNAMKDKYNADIESMEGAALHYVCLQKNIRFLQIRGVSNKVGERDKSKWNFKEAIKSSNQLLEEIYSSLKKIN
jgi:futalosine hydrolase